MQSLLALRKEQIIPLASAGASPLSEYAAGVPQLATLKGRSYISNISHINPR